ncbi:MAG: 2-amino-4-hydroxy-6-hydroxymethyldihydropteridine diphosphokinase, partial [Burkholderiaceae bacterium]
MPLPEAERATSAHAPKLDFVSMMPMAVEPGAHRYFVGLGANLGDPTATVNAAFAALASLPQTTVRQCSALFRTAPVGITEQPEFI